MAATGLDVFDKTLQTTNIWLDEVMAQTGADRQVAWHILGAVVRAVRDRLPLELSAHLSAQLPLLVRGAFYDQWRPAEQPERYRSLEDFLSRVAEGLNGTRPVNVQDAVQAVFHVLAHHVDPGQIAKVVDALPEDVRVLWHQSAAVMGKTSSRDAG
jgi:uncharacterized protein (DUF2267 family)